MQNISYFKTLSHQFSSSFHDQSIAVISNFFQTIFQKEKTYKTFTLNIIKSLTSLKIINKIQISQKISNQNQTTSKIERDFQKKKKQIQNDLKNEIQKNNFLDHICKRKIYLKKLFRKKIQQNRKSPRRTSNVHTQRTTETYNSREEDKNWINPILWNHPPR